MENMTDTEKEKLLEMTTDELKKHVRYVLWEIDYAGLILDRKVLTSRLLKLDADIKSLLGK